MESINSVTNSIVASNQFKRNPALEIPQEVQSIILDQFRESVGTSIPTQQIIFGQISRNYYDSAMQALYKSPLPTAYSSRYISKLSILAETVITKKNLALYVRKLNLKEIVPSLSGALANCSGLLVLVLEIHHKVLKALTWLEEGPLLETLKCVKISGEGFCDCEGIMEFIKAIAGTRLEELYLDNLSTTSSVPLIPSLPTRISTFTSFATDFSTLTSFLPIQYDSLSPLNLTLEGPVKSFGILKTLSKIKFLSITGTNVHIPTWSWVGKNTQESSYDFLGYFPDLFEIVLRHPLSISSEEFTLLITTSPNLINIDFRFIHWSVTPQKDQLSMLKGRKLEKVELAIMTTLSSKEKEELLALKEELLIEGYYLHRLDL